MKLAHAFLALAQLGPVHDIIGLARLGSAWQAHGLPQPNRPSTEA
jgi:hypothetical protein